jgi:hypothetical protein
MSWRFSHCGIQVPPIIHSNGKQGDAKATLPLLSTICDRREGVTRIRLLPLNIPFAHAGREFR